MPEELTIEKYKLDDQTAVLRLRGWLDQDGAVELRRTCEWLRRQDYIHIVLSLSGVTFMASSGAGTVMILNTEFDMIGGSLQLVELSDAVWRVVKALNLESNMTIRSTERQATDSLRSRR